MRLFFCCSYSALNAVILPIAISKLVVRTLRSVFTLPRQALPSSVNSKYSEWKFPVVSPYFADAATRDLLRLLLGERSICLNSVNRRIRLTPCWSIALGICSACSNPKFGYALGPAFRLSFGMKVCSVTHHLSKGPARSGSAVRATGLHPLLWKRYHAKDNYGRRGCHICCGFPKSPHSPSAASRAGFAIPTRHWGMSRLRCAALNMTMGRGRGLV